MGWPSRTLGGLVCVLVVSVSSPARPADFSSVDRAAQEAVAAGEIPGAVILVGQGDRVLYRKAFGWRRLVPEREPMTEDTIFDLASLTKVVATTSAVMLLWEQGKLKLDAPIGRYLREFRSPTWEALTVHRLLTHTGGLPPLPPTSVIRRGFPKAAEGLARLQLQSEPGAVFRYSDTGFILLGELVRRVSGQPLDRFLSQRLFTPLGMRETTFHPDPSFSSRVAPTEMVRDRLLHGEVHDENARFLGGVAGHAGLFSTADDLARFCRLLVNQGRWEGRQILKATTVRSMLAPIQMGETLRGLGWDMVSPFSRTMAPFFPSGSIGHTGFTGTALWIDPATKTYLILLTNRVHPYGKGNVSLLRTRVAAAVAAELFAAAPKPVSPLPGGEGSPAADGGPLVAPGRVQSGLDVLVAQNFAPLSGRTLGLVTNQTGVDHQGRRVIDLLAGAPGVTLAAIFSPEHGVIGTASGHVPHGRDPVTGLPIWSLYGAERRPSDAQLRGLDALVVDLQDVGTRFYTYLTTLVYVLEEGARLKVPVVVLDRPNPITGKIVEGPLMDPDLRSFTAPHPVPVRTGLTMGEFAKLVVAERRLPVALTVVALGGWERRQWYDETGLPWVNPSPNIRSLTQALLYPGVGLLEGTNVSVGRGTETPFELIGAPWIDGTSLAEAMNARQLPGVHFVGVTFTPSADRYAGERVGGVRIFVTDREAIRPVTVGLALARELRDRYTTEFRAEAIQNLLVNRAAIWALLRGQPLFRLLELAQADLADFLLRRQRHLLYR
jgi:uncharacterized protein YbbC (DUF1343 family)/CubicO group peptidase (beta-lactamase class C family)